MITAARRRSARLVLTGCAWAALAGCTTVRSISINQLPEKSQRQSMVRAHAWSPIILFIPFGSGFVDDARADLVAQCTGGAIEGTLAKFEDVNYFLWLYATQNVTLEGYCVHRHDQKGDEKPSRHGGKA